MLRKIFRRLMQCKNCGKKYYIWHESCSVCFRSDTIEPRDRISHRETMDSFQEALALGYSPKEALRDLEECEEVNLVALEEIRD